MTCPLARWSRRSRARSDSVTKLAHSDSVTELLSSLRDPTPMPDDLVARITASVAQERRPVAPRPAPRRRPGQADRCSPSSGLVLGLAGAAAALALVGVAGVHAVMPRAADGSSIPVATAGPAMHAFLGGSPSPRIEVSATRYTDAGLAAQAAALLRRSARPLPPLAAGAAGIGPLGTESGVRECLTRLGLDAGTPATVDLALYRGRPAAVLVSGRAGEQEVRVVPRTCGPGVAVLAGPRRLG